MMKINVLIILFCFVLLLGCKKQQETEELPNIVWITSEDNSKHYMALFDEHGIKTPNIDRMADNGVVFTRAFSNAAVCSAARSSLISGCYGPRAATHYHRKIEKVPMPDSLEMFPAYLRMAGYYTSNNAKEDYNIVKSDTVWNESGKKATWRKRQPGQAFFHVHNIHACHESSVHFTQNDFETLKTKTNPNSCFVQPNHPQTELLKYTNAHYRDKIQQMDNEVGQVLAELEADSLLENTIVFYFGDHGGVLPGSKGYLYETGLHVPLVVSVPEKFQHLIPVNIGEQSNAFVSFIDFGATVLNLAGVEIPKQMDGKAFLGKNISKNELNSRNETFAYADRFDEKYDMVRSYRKGKFKYIRNYQPFNFDGLMNNYRYKQLAYQQWLSMYNAQELNKIQSLFFETKPAEMLFDVEADPFETNNLAANAEYAEVLTQMRGKMTQWVKSMPDLSFYPEFYLINKAFDNPVSFGQTHKQNIESYVDIADLMLTNFAEAEAKLQTALNSDDPWQRYWALIVCSSFESNALAFESQIKTISENDSQLINRVRRVHHGGTFHT